MVTANTLSHSASATDTRQWREALTAPWIWHGLAIAGMVLVFAGLAIDAWTHNAGNAGNESLISFTNPGHAIAGIGLGLALAGLLMSISLIAATHAAASARPIPVLALAAAAWVVAVGSAVGAVTYIAATGTTVGHAHDAAAGGAMASGAGGAHVHEAGAHDHGAHPSYSEIMTEQDAALLPRFPAGKISASDMPLLRTQLREASGAAARFKTIQDAEAAGYRQTTTDVDYMGLHYLSIENVTDGVFDPARPEGLLFSRIGGTEATLVGVWYLQTPGVGNVSRDVEPAGFAGDVDYWHGHQNVCLPFETEGGTESDCVASGGRFVSDSRWMMHAWVVPTAGDNPNGVFAYLNESLYTRQLAFSGGDADSDADGLRDSLELRFRQNPIGADSDADGLTDGRDIDWLRVAITDLPEGSLESADAGERTALARALDSAGAKFAGGDAAGGIAELQVLRTRLDNCALEGTGAPWMEACSRQAEARGFVDLLIANTPQ